MGPLHFLQHWLAIHTGTYIPNGQYSVYYNAWSGWVSDIGLITLVTAVIFSLRGHNCHHKGCWRLSFHVSPKGRRLCKKHVGWAEDDLDMHDIHPDHQ